MEGGHRKTLKTGGGRPSLGVRKAQSIRSGLIKNIFQNRKRKEDEQEERTRDRRKESCELERVGWTSEKKGIKVTRPDDFKGRRTSEFSDTKMGGRVSSECVKKGNKEGEK